MDMSSNEQQIKSLIQFGAGVALFGQVCPLFWMSLFFGGPGSDTWVYGIHSGIIILIGLVLLGKGWYDLKSMRASQGIKKPEL